MFWSPKQKCLAAPAFTVDIMLHSDSSLCGEKCYELGWVGVTSRDHVGCGGWSSL